VYVAQAAGWQEAHSAMPGTVVHAYGLATVVACRDGHIAMLDWHLFDANAVTGTTAR